VLSQHVFSAVLEGTAATSVNLLICMN